MHGFVFLSGDGRDLGVGDPEKLRAGAQGLEKGGIGAGQPNLSKGRNFIQQRPAAGLVQVGHDLVQEQQGRPALLAGPQADGGQHQGDAKRLLFAGRAKFRRPAVAKMHELGFDKVWTEEVEHYYWERGSIETKIVSPYHHKLVALALGGSVATPDQGITAEIVQFDNFTALQAAPANSLEGKIAYVSHQMTRAMDGSGYGPAVAARSAGALKQAVAVYTIFTYLTAQSGVDFRK